MAEKENICTRRNFLKTAGAAGVGSMLAVAGAVTNAYGESAKKIPENMVVPTRDFGKTGIKVSKLGFGAGGGIDTMSNQLLLKQLKLRYSSAVQEMQV